MEFITENYIWFIIAGIIILMTIIGYIADKTDFGKKKPEKKKKEKEPKQKDEIVETDEMADLDEVPVELPQDDLDPVETFPADFEETKPAFDTDEMDLAPQVDDFDKKEPEKTTEEIPEELFAGVDGTPNVYKQEEQPVEEVKEEMPEEKKEDENLEIELPSIETLNQELADETEDDDVWKF